MSTPTIRPSALPMLKDCAQFSGAGSDFAEAGTDRHAALTAYLRGNKEESEFLAGEDSPAIEWAGEYIRLHANSGHQLYLEETREYRLATGELVFRGTPDVLAGKVGEGVEIFDLKWRMIDHLDYTSQMAAYAMMALIDFKLIARTCKVHLLYGAFKRHHVLEFDLDSATKLVWDIIQKVKQEEEPTLCDHCGWCSKAFICSAQKAQVDKVVAGRPDWELENYHSSEITDPVQMSKALSVARAISKWAEAVEFHAKEMAVAGQIQIPGFKVQSRNGKRFIPDINGAFKASGLPPDRFLKCCNVTMGKLEDEFAEHRGVSKAAGKRDVESVLGSYIEMGARTYSLVKERSK